MHFLHSIWKMLHLNIRHKYQVCASRSPVTSLPCCPCRETPPPSVRKSCSPVVNRWSSLNLSVPLPTSRQGLRTPAKKTRRLSRRESIWCQKRIKDKRQIQRQRQRQIQRRLKTNISSVSISTKMWPFSKTSKATHAWTKRRPQVTCFFRWQMCVVYFAAVNTLFLSTSWSQVNSTTQLVICSDLQRSHQNRIIWTCKNFYLEHNRLFLANNRHKCLKVWGKWYVILVLFLQPPQQCSAANRQV